MISILLLLGSVLVLAIGVMIFQLAHAPMGLENEEGFQFGQVSGPQRKMRAAKKGKSIHRSAHGISTHIPAI